MQYIEDICFFEVNTKYISSSELKTSEFSRVRSTSENFYVSTLPKKSKFSFYFILYTGISQFTRQAVKMQKPKRGYSFHGDFCTMGSCNAGCQNQRNTTAISKDAFWSVYEQPHEKINNLQMPKQRHRSASG